jgi:hypothetical protein
MDDYQKNKVFDSVDISVRKEVFEIASNSIGRDLRWRYHEFVSGEIGYEIYVQIALSLMSYSERLLNEKN